MKIIFFITSFLLISNMAQTNFDLDSRIKCRELTITENKELYLGQIVDFAADLHNNLFLIDKNNIYRFNSEGLLQKRIYKNGSGPGEFKSLFKIITDYDQIILSDIGNHKLLIYTKNLEFKSEFKLDHLDPIVDWKLAGDNLLVCYCFSSPDTHIWIYDLKEKKLKTRFGKNHHLFIKYKAFDFGGGLAKDNKYLYYISNHEYQVYQCSFNGNCTPLIKDFPAHFKLISSPRNPAKIFESNYSTIIGLYLIDECFYVISIPPSKGNKITKPVYDVYSKQGELLAEKLFSKYIIRSKQISTNRFVYVFDSREKYGPGHPDSKILVRFLEVL